MKITFLLAALVVVALTVAPAIIDGQRRFRWGENSEIEQLKERLVQFPTVIGQWELSSEEELDSSSRNLLRPLAYVNRIYLNVPNQLRAHVVILLGPTGRTAAHTPDICFNSRAYSKTGERKRVKVNPGRTKSMCFETRFTSRDVDGNLLTSWYGWTTDGIWHAPDRPRFEFASSPYLFKVQLAVNCAESEQQEVDEIVNKFLKDIEKNLRNTVFDDN